MKDVMILTINDRKILHENLDDEIKQALGIKLKQIIYISKHNSKTGEPTLTVHPIGNYAKAMFGGRDKTLVKSAPRLMTELLRLLNQNAIDAKTYHKVCFEVSHHGPHLKTPTIFVEVGSSKEEWVKEKPAGIVAKSVLDLIDKYHYEEDLANDIPVILGIGGGHYAPRFTDVALEKKSAFGHMIPTYQINDENFDIEMVQKALDATPDVTAAYIHRKALKKSQIREYRALLETKGIPTISSKELEYL